MEKTNKTLKRPGKEEAKLRISPTLERSETPGKTNRNVNDTETERLKLREASRRPSAHTTLKTDVNICCIYCIAVEWKMLNNQVTLSIGSSSVISC